MRGSKPREKELLKTVVEIARHGTTYALIIRAGARPDATTFVTPSTANLQVGFIVYPAGGEVARHEHRSLERTILGMNEVLVVQQGACDVDIYDLERRLIGTYGLNEGDILIFMAGGHGFRMRKDTVLLEVKQGPYIAEDEKELF